MVTANLRQMTFDILTKKPLSTKGNAPNKYIYILYIDCRRERMCTTRAFECLRIKTAPKNILTTKKAQIHFLNQSQTKSKKTPETLKKSPYHTFLFFVVKRIFSKKITCILNSQEFICVANGRKVTHTHSNRNGNRRKQQNRK